LIADLRLAIHDDQRTDQNTSKQQHGCELHGDLFLPQVTTEVTRYMKFHTRDGPWTRNEVLHSRESRWARRYNERIGTLEKVQAAGFLRRDPVATLRRLPVIQLAPPRIPDFWYRPVTEEVKTPAPLYTIGRVRRDEV